MHGKLRGKKSLTGEIISLSLILSIRWITLKMFYSCHAISLASKTTFACHICPQMGRPYWSHVDVVLFENFEIVSKQDFWNAHYAGSQVWANYMYFRPITCLLSASNMQSLLPIIVYFLVPAIFNRQKMHNFWPTTSCLWWR